MKSRYQLIPQTILAAALLFAASTLQADSVRYDGQPGSSVKIEGTSTIHDWSMESKIIGGSVELDAKVQIDTSKATLAGVDGNKVPMKANAKIPVRSLKSYTTAMDNVYQDAMEEKQFKAIEFNLTEITVKEGEHKAGAPFDFSATGDLIVHGVTNKITMPVTIENLEGGKLKIKGNTSLKMTAFGVKPPAPKIAMGMIKTGDDIKITFEWIVGPKPKE